MTILDYLKIVIITSYDVTSNNLLLFIYYNNRMGA